MILYSTRAYAPLCNEILSLAAFEFGVVETRLFPDGERYQRLTQDVEDRDVALVAGTISDADTLELYDLACALVKHGARSLALVIPYFGYSTMERAVLPGEVVTAKSRARLLSSIPLASCGNRVALLDLHSAGLPYYFEGSVRPVHLYAKPVITAAALRLAGGSRDFVLACTDAGRAKWVESLANDLGVHAAFVFKRRVDGDKLEVTGVSAAVQGKQVIIYDDMIRTGSSLLQAAQAYRAAGASSIAAIATHGLFPGDSLVKIQSSGLFREVVCTDSHPRARELLAGRSDAFFRVETVAGLLASYLKGNACA